MNTPTADPKVPSYLLSIQKWFASIITRPIDSESQMMSISPSGRLMSEEAQEFISPSLKLSSDQRIQIYNQQYWWRLLSILHQNFPTLTRLFGYSDFNLSIGMPFLTKYPSRHWSISQLGDQLTIWIDQYYEAKDKALIYSTAEVDWAYQAIFFAKPSLYFPPSPNLLSKKLCLQAHVKLFNLQFDIFSLRTELLKEDVEFWMKSDFPFLSKDKSYFFILYRTRNNRILYKEVEEGQWLLLNLISQEFTIEEACDQLEETGGKAYDDAVVSLGLWIQEWINEGWLIPVKL